MLISGFFSVKRMRVLTPPGWDTNKSQVSYHQTLVLIYLPWKDRRLSYHRRKKRSHKYSNLGRARIKLGTLWLESRDLATAQTMPLFSQGRNQLPW